MNSQNKIPEMPNHARFDEVLQGLELRFDFYRQIIQKQKSQYQDILMIKMVTVKLKTIGLRQKQQQFKLIDRSENMFLLEKIKQQLKKLLIIFLENFKKILGLKFIKPQTNLQRNSKG
ncbi:unnamed protein product [Paramecium primaurelia]|uniref:Uncharacterized protein n=1 Tax=Paramecium primaurelia TaxID=5886 RepID=A0A8S1QDM0_PARPR|nr:unnamed protein product [Paramecium primaurelia]